MEMQHQSNLESAKKLQQVKLQEGEKEVCAHVKRQKSQRTNQTGHWKDSENAKYYAFLSKFKQEFSERESRRQCKVFKAMSEFLKTRTSKQCRSHHHKMKAQFRQIDDILKFLTSKKKKILKEAQKHSKELLNKTVENFTAGSEEVGSQDLEADQIKPNNPSFYSIPISPSKSFMSHQHSAISPSQSVISPSKSFMSNSQSVISPSKSFMSNSQSIISPSQSIISPSKSFMSNSQSVMSHSQNVMNYSQSILNQILSPKKPFSNFKTNLSYSGKIPRETSAENPPYSPQKPHNAFPATPTFQPVELYPQIYQNAGPYASGFIPNSNSVMLQNNLQKMYQCQYYFQNWTTLLKQLFGPKQNSNHQ